MDWDVKNVVAITGQAFANANQLTTGQSSRLGSIDKKVIAGGTYYLHGWARKTTVNGVLTVGLETTAPDGTGTTTTMYTVTTTATNTWYEYSGSITIPAGHNLGRCIATATNGTVQYASFYCKPHAPSATRNIGRLADLDRNVPSTAINVDNSNIFIDPNLSDSAVLYSSLTYNTQWSLDVIGTGESASQYRVLIEGGYAGSVSTNTDYLTTGVQPSVEYIFSAETQMHTVGTGGSAGVYAQWYYWNGSSFSTRGSPVIIGALNTTTSKVQQKSTLTCPSNANAVGLVFTKADSGGIGKDAYFSSPGIRRAANDLLPDDHVDGICLIDDSVSTIKLTYGETLIGQNLNVSNNPVRTGTDWEGGIIYTANSRTPPGDNGSVCYITAVEVAQIDGNATTTYTGVMGFVAPATFPNGTIVVAHIKGVANTDGGCILDVIVGFKFNAGAFTFLDCNHRGNLIPDVRVTKTAGGLPCIILGQTTTVWANAMFTLAHLQLSGTSVYGPDHALWDGFRTNSLTGYTDTATCVAF